MSSSTISPSTPDVIHDWVPKIKKNKKLRIRFMLSAFFCVIFFQIGDMENEHSHSETNACLALNMALCLLWASLTSLQLPGALSLQRKLAVFWSRFKAKSKYVTGRCSYQQHNGFLSPQCLQDTPTYEKSMKNIWGRKASTSKARGDGSHRKTYRYY